MQGVLPFESLEEIFERVFRNLRPRTEPPRFDVRFRPYANLDSRIRLEEGHRRITVKLSDQLEPAPAAVQEALAHILLSKLFRLPIPEEMERRYRTFVSRSDVRRKAIEVRRRRGRKRLGHFRGHRYDLDLLFDRLNERFFAGGLTKPRLGWSPTRSRRLLGHYDPAHDAIVISRLLDDARIPEFVVEYVLFHEMLHLKHPVTYRERRRCVHSAEFRRDERRYPRFEQANAFLKRL